MQKVHIYTTYSGSRINNITMDNAQKLKRKTIEEKVINI